MTGERMDTNNRLNSDLGKGDCESNNQDKA